eukprot:symbB.v1.2.034550.t1/scaffold4468.1/size39341/4
MAAPTELRTLQRRLDTVGVLPPGRPDDHEGWRECLNQLCEKYLKNSEVKDSSESLPLPQEVQLAALEVRIEEKRKRVLELDVDLKILSEREMKMRRVVEEDPLLQQRSSSDIVRSLQQVRRQMESIAEEDCSDDLDLTGFVEKLKGVLDQVSDSKRTNSCRELHTPELNHCRRKRSNPRPGNTCDTTVMVTLWYSTPQDVVHFEAQLERPKLSNSDSEMLVSSTCLLGYWSPWDEVGGAGWCPGSQENSKRHMG